MNDHSHRAFSSIVLPYTPALLNECRSAGGSSLTAPLTLIYNLSADDMHRHGHGQFNLSGSLRTTSDCKRFSCDSLLHCSVSTKCWTQHMFYTHNISHCHIQSAIHQMVLLFSTSKFVHECENVFFHTWLECSPWSLMNWARRK